VTTDFGKSKIIHKAMHYNCLQTIWSRVPCAFNRQMLARQVVART